MKFRILSACLLIAALLALFCLASCDRCDHEFDEGIMIEYPTCEKKGKVLLTCKKCGGGKYETVQGSHAFSDGAVITAATCLTDGEREAVCVVCGQKGTSVIKATGAHDWVRGEVTKAAVSCTGEQEVSYTCTKCKTTETRKETANGLHVWILENIQVMPSCFAEGEGVYRCFTCGDTKTDVVVATGEHISSGELAGDATGHWFACTTPGCDKHNKSIDHTYVDDPSVKPVEPDGCRPGSKGVVCTECGYKTTVKVKSASSLHTLGAPVLDSSGTSVTYPCKVCGESFTYALTYCYTFENRNTFPFVDQNGVAEDESTAIKVAMETEGDNHFRTVIQTVASPSSKQFQTNGGGTLRFTAKTGFVEFKIRPIGNSTGDTLSISLFNTNGKWGGDSSNCDRAVRLLDISGRTVKPYGPHTGNLPVNSSIATLSPDAWTTIRVEYEISGAKAVYTYFVNGTAVAQTVLNPLNVGLGTGDYTSVYFSGNVTMVDCGYALDDIFIGSPES